MADNEQTGTASVRDRRSRRGWWIAGAAAVAAVVAVAVGVSLQAPTDQPDDATVVSPLPTPTPGTTHTLEPEAPIEVAIDATAELVPGVRTTLTRLEAVEGEGRFPGETSGPAIRTTIEVQNLTDEALNISGASVTLAYGPGGSPAVEVGAPGSQPFPESVAAGETVASVYLFTVPLEERDPIRVTLDLLATAPVVVYVGVGPTS